MRDEQAMTAEARVAESRVELMAYNSARTLIDTEWLRSFLIEKVGFSAQLVHTHLGECLAHLLANDVFTRGEFVAIVNGPAWDELVDIYRTVLRRFSHTLESDG